MKFRKYFKWVKVVYLILALLTVGLGLPNVLSVDAAVAAMQKLGMKGSSAFDPQITMAIVYGVEALIYVGLASLAGRIARNKSQGVFLAFLLVISAVGSVYSLMKGVEVRNILNLAVDAIMLVMLIGVWVTDK